VPRVDVIKITKRSLEHGTIEDALATAWRATLPESLAESELVNWVLGDGRAQGHRNKETADVPMSNRPREWVALAQLYRWLLEQWLPLYADWLFAFGRPMRATEFALIDCERVRSGDSLKAVAGQFALQTKGMDTKRAEALIASLANDAIAEHRANLKRYASVRSIWETEVSEFRGNVERVRGLTPHEVVLDLPLFIGRADFWRNFHSAVPDALEVAGIRVESVATNVEKPLAIYESAVRTETHKSVLGKRQSIGTGAETGEKRTIHRLPPKQPTVERSMHAFEKAAAAELQQELERSIRAGQKHVQATIKSVRSQLKDTTLKLDLDTAIRTLAAVALQVQQLARLVGTGPAAQPRRSTRLKPATGTAAPPESGSRRPAVRKPAARTAARQEGGAGRPAVRKPAARRTPARRRPPDSVA
jgi:hypothetical protein